MEKLISLANNCRQATPHDSVLNNECVYTFHSPYTTEMGIVVNLKTFVGTVQELAFSGADNDDDNDQVLCVRIVKKRVEKMQEEKEKSKEQEQQEETVKKLGVGIEGGFQAEDDLFETISKYSIVLLQKNDKNVDVIAEFPYDESKKNDFPTQIINSADSIIHHSGLAIQQDLKTWELDDEPKPISKYCETIPFIDNGIKVSPNPADWKVSDSKFPT